MSFTIVAKNIVAAGLTERCEVQIAYAIGVAEPVSLYVSCFNTNKIPEDKILGLIKKFSFGTCRYYQTIGFKAVNLSKDCLLRPLWQRRP